jgi:hypothetical protein
MAKTFDPACWDLAERFLADEPLLNTEAAKTTLAAHIQEAIEDEIAFMRSHFPIGQRV